MKNDKVGICVFGIVFLLMVLVSSAYTAQWQWSMQVDKQGRIAYLWIPPSCNHVRGLILGDENTLEETALESPIIREAAEKAELGIVWFVPKSFGFFKYKEGAGEQLLKVLTDLARESGYKEIEFAPLLPIGHSASSPFAWYVACWKPERTIALISLKGAIFPSPDFDKGASMEGVPALAITGEYYEWPEPIKSRFERWKGDRDVLIGMRRASEKNLCSFFVDVSRGHFDWTDDLAHIVALYITKAAHYRLPAEAPLDGPVKLKTISPESGWLVDPNMVKLTKFAKAAYKEYPGGKSDAAWYFDEEMAEAVSKYGVDQKGKTYQMVDFVQDGNMLQGAVKGYTSLRYVPMADDEMSFKLAGAYLENTPPELVNQGSLSGHAAVSLRFVCMIGPVVQAGPDMFRLRFNRLFRSAPARAQVLVYSPGDEKYRMAFQPGAVQIPANKTGKAQKIIFPQIDNQTVGTKSIELKATADSNLPVEFYVIYGPAEVEGNRLVFSKIPPRSKFPVKVSVVAYQWGHMREPKVQTAKPVEQIFLIESSRAKQQEN